LPSDVKNHNGTGLRAKALLLISAVLIFLQDLRIPILNQSGQVNATLLLVGAIVGGDVVPHCKVLADHRHSSRVHPPGALMCLHYFLCTQERLCSPSAGDIISDYD
jgi:hypothetical protein